MTGYVYVTLLLLVLIALGFVLSGGIILSDDSASTIESTERYTIADTGTIPSNPTLQLSTLDFVPQVCGGGGYDIALVIDISGSVSPYLSEIRVALISFVEAFSDKSTQFSVTKFDDKATKIIPEFTDDLNKVITEINSLSGRGGYTNWQDAFVKAKETLNSTSNRPSVKDLVVFASDGEPNRTGENGDFATLDTAVNNAVDVADEIKEAGARIITFGIGSGVKEQNLQAISGSNPEVVGDVNVILTNFANLGTDLQSLTANICGP